jgi:hypothetical protein
VRGGPRKRDPGKWFSASMVSQQTSRLSRLILKFHLKKFIDYINSSTLSNVIVLHISKFGTMRYVYVL